MAGNLLTVLPGMWDDVTGLIVRETRLANRNAWRGQNFLLLH
jgi:hypothetical protein